MMQELAEQLKEPVDVIFFASGSGGTATGIAVGAALCPAFRNTRIVGYAVCDTPDYFYDHVQHELTELGMQQQARDIIEFRDAKGVAYAVNTEAEIELVRSVARTSGIALDGAYTGKAVYGFVRDRAVFAGKRCLFVHTGGAYSLFGMPLDVIVQKDLVCDF